MQSYGANIVVHIDEELSDNAISDMEQRLSGIDGVVSACVHERTRHLWVIDYDPHLVDSGELLQRIRKNGLHAELIGGV